MTRDKRQDSEIEIECVKLRADKEPSPFTVKFTSDEQTAAFQYLGSRKAGSSPTGLSGRPCVICYCSVSGRGGNVPVQAEAIKAYCKSELGYSSRTVERALKIGIRDDVLHKPQRGYYQIVRREGSQ